MTNASRVHGRPLSAFIASLLVGATFAQVACSGSRGSVGVEVTPPKADAGDVPGDPADAGRPRAEAGPPPGVQPASNGAFLVGDGGVAWWPTGLFTIADGLAADPLERRSV